MKNTFDQIRKNWALLLFIGSVIISFTTIQNKVQAQEKALAYTDKKVEMLEKSTIESGQNIAIIQTNVEWIKKSQNETNENLKDLIKWVRRSSNGRNLAPDN